MRDETKVPDFACAAAPTPIFAFSSAAVLAMVLLTLATAGCSNEKRADTGPSVPIARAALPKLVDLGATACIPCKMMAPILEKLVVEYAGVLDVEFVDVWQPENKELAKSYGIAEIPTQVFLDPEGNELWRHVGFISKADILAQWSKLGYDLKPSNDALSANVAAAATSPSADQRETRQTEDGPSRITE